MTYALQRFHLRILTTNFPACFHFYQSVLELPLRYGDQNQVYAEFKSDILHIALFDRQSMAQVLGSAHLPAEADAQDKQVIVLRVHDVDQAFGYLSERGAHFITRPTDRPEWGCRTAHFQDPAGTLFELNADFQEDMDASSQTA